MSKTAAIGALLLGMSKYQIKNTYRLPWPQVVLEDARRGGKSITGGNMDRIDQSVANLLNIIREQDKQLNIYQLLADLLFGRGGNILEGQSVDVFHNIDDLIYYLSDTSYDYLVLIIPGIPVQAFDRELIDKLTEAGTLEGWIREQWREETVALGI